MHLVLDSNEYIFAFGPDRRPDCVKLFDAITSHPRRFRIFVNRRIVWEVSQNVRTKDLRRCHQFWHSLDVMIDEDAHIPFLLAYKYELKGLKPADAVIGAYCEFVGADLLISENRDFLALARPLPFHIMKAAEFLKEMAA